MTHETINVAGIDTGKVKLDIALLPGGQELQVVANCGRRSGERLQLLIPGRFVVVLA